MFEDLDLLLTDVEPDGIDLNYWYDCGWQDVVEILDEFDDEDWEELFEKLDSKSDNWKKRLAYCMDDPGNPNHFKVLKILSHTIDDGLFLATIDRLRSGFDLDALDNKEEILRKINRLESSNIIDRFEQKMIMDFKNKINKK